MKKNLFVILTAFALCILLIPNFLLSFETDSYIVKFKKGFDEKKVKDKIQSFDLTLKPLFKSSFLEASKKKNKTLTTQQIYAFEELTQYYIVEIKHGFQSNAEMFQSNSDVLSFEPNYKFRIEEVTVNPNDPSFKKQWALNNTNVQEAWKKATGKGILIGIVDTGIDWFHPELIKNLWVNSKEDINNNGQFDSWSSDIEKNGITGDLNAIDDDGNGFADDVIGYDFIDQTIVNVGDSKDIDPIPQDEQGHGTSVAGVIAAGHNNGIGISGIAYDAKLLMARAFDATGNGESDDIAAAIVYSVLQGVKVLNFSFGEVYQSTIIHDAIRFAYANNVAMAASSGNNNWTLKHYPSDFDEVISCGASDFENIKDSKSNYGNKIGICAPGTDIYTTAVDSSYRTISGTSFSSPHIVAAAALLLELNPELTPADIYGILQSSAADVGDNGWDIELGAGILNIGSAVNSVGISNISISKPQNEAFIERSDLMYPVIGNIVTPLFESYQIMLGQGENSKTWQPVTDVITEQKINDTLGLINLSQLNDTVYVFRLLIKLKNNNTIEKRNYIQIISPETDLEFTSLKSINAFNGKQKMTVIYAVTNFPSYCKVGFKPKGSSEEFKFVSEYQKYTNFHTIIIDETHTDSIKMEAEIFASLPNNLNSSKKFEFTLPSIYSPEYSFESKPYSFPNSYLLNQVSDLYNNGKASIAVNDLSSGSWGNLKTYEFDNNEFYTKDSFKNTWIPKGIGDSNNDGIPEIFTFMFRESALFQAKEKGSSPFGRVLFSDTLSLNYWAQGMVDMDKDGAEDLLAFSDTAFIAHSFKNGKYQYLDQAEPHFSIGTFPGFASGDFDNDGNEEICFGNRDGNIAIYDFVNGKFNLEFLDTSTFSSSEQYMASADVDGDKIPEIVIGNFGSSANFGIEDAGEPIWTYRIFKSINRNEYKILHTEYIYGVRGGNDYNNGLTAGDADGDGRDEIIISAFPNLYILKWDTADKELLPLWVYPYTYSNSAVVYDFDKNGINEIGFGTFNGTRFYEMDKTSRPSIPLGFKGWSLDTNKAYFEWQPVANAEKYEIYNMIPTDSGYSPVLTYITTETSAIIDTFQNNKHYEFIVIAVNNSMPETQSNISSFIDIFTHKPVEPVNVSVQGDNEIMVSFSGKLPNNNINAGDFEISHLSLGISTNPTTAIIGNDTLVILHFDNKLIVGNYKIYIHSFTDGLNSPTIAKELEFIKLEDDPIEEYYLTKLDVINNSKIELFFSEIPDPLEVKNIDNYTLLPIGKINKIDLNPDDINSVFITLDKNTVLLASGKNYTLTVQNVNSITGVPITKGAGNTLGFVFYADNPDDPYIYPNPVRISEAKEIYFANLPPKAEVVIYSLDQIELNRLFEYDSNGGVEWDGRDKNGEFLTNGVYLFKVIISNTDGSKTESELKKFIILN